MADYFHIRSFLYPKPRNMRKLKISLVPALFFCLCFLNVSAQQGSVAGKILESPTNKPVGLATIAVYKASDTSLLSYRLSTHTGDFKVPGLPLNIPLRLLITHTGFEAYRFEFELNSIQTSLITDTVKMIHTSKTLDELVVMAELPPIVIKKDTIEFNAVAFKTLPNALVEDLLKKLPGIEVERDGTISVEGKIVNRILVDGKTFFGDDPKMATRNLPANVIDKVQVTDDKEEMIRRGDDNPNNVGKVINLTFKKGVKKGWFGRVYAGGATKELYTTGGIANIYRDTLQLSVLAYANNINKAPFSFSELLSVGGFQRNRSNSANQRTNVWRTFGLGTGISLDNVNFGGAQGGVGGISISKGTGFNLNHAPNTKRSFFLQYFYNRLDIRKRELQNLTDQFFGDTVINTNTRQTGPSFGNRHNLAAGLRLKPDSVTNILLNAAFMDAGGIDERITTVSTTNNFTGPLSAGNINLKNDSKINTYRHNFSLTRLSKVKRGRRFTIGHDLDYRNSQFDNYSNSQNHFKYPVVYDTSILQLRLERIPATDLDFYFNFSEPLTKQFTFRLAARYDILKYKNNISTYNFNNTSKTYDLFNALLTNSLHRRNDQLTANAGLEYKWKELTITPGLKLQRQKIINDISNLPIPLEQKRTNLLPTFNLVYKTWNLYYDQNVILPGYNYLIAVADNANPFYITLGNPDLVPSVINQVFVNYRKNILKKLLNYSLNLQLAFTKNDVIGFITVDDKGVFTNKPVNQSGSRYGGINIFINKQYKRSTKFNFSLNSRVFFNNNRSRLLYNYTATWQNNYSLGARTGFNMNSRDKFEWSSNYAITYNFHRYKVSAFKDIDQVYHIFENEWILRFPKHFIWEANMQYYIDAIAQPGYSPRPSIWNAAVNYTMMKNERGVLKFEVSDMFNTYRHTLIDVLRNSVTIRTNNVIGRYFMLSFTYNIQTIGEKKKIGGWRLSLF